MENLIRAIGDPGKFQVFMFSLISVNLMIMLSAHFSMIFYGAKTEHHCKLDANKNVSDFIPFNTQSNNKERDSCHMFEGTNNSNKTPCTNGWIYIMKDNERTIISEFDLVCDDAYKVDLSTTIYFTGVTLGGIFFGVIADKFGRRPVIAFTLLAAGVLNVAIFIFRNYIAFAIFRFFLGLSMQGLQSSSVVLAMELFPTRYRSHIGALCGLIANIGGLCLGVLAFIIKDWRYLQLVLSVVPFMQMFSLWFIPESVRWNMLHGHFIKARRVVRRITKANRLDFPEETFQNVKEQSVREINSSKTKDTASILDIYREPSLRMTSLILTIVWFSITITFYGLSFNISFLFGNKYFNFIFGQVIDVLMVSSLLWSLPRFGRRKPLLVILPNCTVALVTCAVIAGLNKDSKNVNLIRTIAALGGKSLSGTCINVMILYTAELYPTILRNIGFGVAMFWCRLGAMAAPQLFFVKRFSKCLQNGLHKAERMTVMTTHKRQRTRIIY
ncbi:solute carrier family 22 member 8-like isoform X2 [Xenia sp. Carnegie-2017]|uniref:solute carrier family 22 member 8-like isoform X2 n=1 Tax=Xenia sp. Carnegie-2017 TaxID=2897299 RepID=UPI001F040A5E|nr:solute carrier family 22 member 8-like isoform X2 [Xenia sp. Carnegie-2017]